jgi:hypothetical protein
MIPDIEKFLPVAIFKMATTIPHKFNIVRFQRPELIPNIEESFRDIIIYPHMKCCWNRTMLNICGIVVAILKMATGRNISMSGIISGHHNLPTYEMLLKSNNDNDVPNWFPTLKNFYWSPFSKWPPQYCTNSTMSDFNARNHFGTS